ncbi:MAG: AAA family ATPase [Corallincola sp.]|nr:AAA family ATPase [Corallincola sp.]
MYLYHFGLRELPFMLTPNTGFYCALTSHQEALATLITALKTGEGFIKVVGEVGTGKTLLCRKLLHDLPDHFVTAWLPNPDLAPAALRLAVASELRVDNAASLGEEGITAAIQQRLLALHRQGHSVVLLVDEAQALSDAALELLRLFTNLETEQRKLLQVVLFGQPELDQRLASPQLRQLRQRITFSYRLRAMNRREVAAYVHHRLQVAGSQPPWPLANRTLLLLARASRGVPRLVNILCHKALLLAFGRGLAQAGWREMAAAIWDTEDTRPFLRRQLWLYGLLLASCGAAVGSQWL